MNHLSEIASALVPLMVVIVATLGGAKAYAWQRSVDRKIEQQSAKRDSYLSLLDAQRNLLSSTVELQMDESVPDQCSEAINAYRKSLDEFSLMSSPNLQFLALNADVSLTRFLLEVSERRDTATRNKSIEEVTKLRASLITAMRDDLSLGDLAESSENIGQHFATNEALKLRILRVLNIAARNGSDS